MHETKPILGTATVQVFTQDLLNQLSAEAKQSPRRRTHHNLHASLDENFQRLLIAIEPQSFVTPHRHLTPAKPECLVGLRGMVAVVTFDDEGKPTTAVRVGPRGDAQGCDIPPGTWHTAVCLEEDTVILEAKLGPYQPVEPSDVAAWAPREGDDACEDYLQQLTEFIAQGN